MRNPQIPNIPLRPLQRISPSRFTALQGCQLREIWQAQREVPPLLPGGTSGKIGSIIHKIIELTFKGFIRSEEDFERYWDEELAKCEQIMMSNPLEADMLPLSDSRNYEIKRYGCFLLISKQLNKKLSNQILGKIRIQPEIWLETADKKVGGKIDLIREFSNYIQIIDFKSGKVIDPVLNTAKSEYQVQLKLYAGLYHSVYGAWPSRLTLVGIDHEEIDVDMSPIEVQYLLSTAKNLLDNINQNMSNNSQEFFASPTPLNCNYCTFRPACQKYWSTRTNHLSWPTDLIGQVVDVKSSVDGFLKVELEHQGHEMTIRGLNTEKYSFLLSSNLNEVCMCNLRIHPAPGFYIPTKSTLGYILS